MREGIKIGKFDLLEIARFGVVGVLATAIHYGVYLLLNPYMNANIAYTIGYVVSFICNFFLSNYFSCCFCYFFQFRNFTCHHTICSTITINCCT